MDQFAIDSTKRSKQANEDGSFAWEIAPVTVPGKAGETVIRFDEQPFKAKLDKIPGLKPAFKKDGTITAATLVEHLRRRGRAGADARVDGDAGSASSRSRGSSATASTRRRPTGSRRRRSARSRRS